MENDFATGYMCGSDGHSNDGMFGGQWIWAFLIIALIFNGGSFGGWGNGANSAAAQGALTRSDLCSEFNFNNLASDVRGVQNGLCDGFYSANTTALNGFNGVNTAITAAANNLSNGITQLGYQSQQCCCNVRSDIKDLAYQSAKDTCDIINANNANTDRIIGFLTQDKIESLRDQLQTANFQLSQQAQNSTLINALRPVPAPAYITCSPYESAMLYSRSGCGCS